jgi:hypothetical protein
MSGGKLKSERRFQKGINVDIDEESMPVDQYRLAMNIEGGYGVGIGIRRPHRGFRRTPFEYPVGGGPYEVIGAEEDKVNKRLIFFVSDTSGNGFDHVMMVSLLPGGINPANTRLLEFDMSFDSGNPVHSAVIIGGCIYWTDGNMSFDRTQILGNPPRKLCIDRHANRKEIEYELLFNQDCYEINTQFDYQLFTIDGNVVSGVIPLYTVPASGDPAGAMLGLFNAMDSGTGGVLVPEPYPLNTAANPAKVLRFRCSVDDRRVVITVSNGGAPDPEVLQNELNFYPLPSITPDFGRMLQVIKPCPPCPPEVRYERDTSIAYSNIYGQAYQFRHRYLYVDGEASAWGPCSIVPTNFFPRGLGPVPPSTNDQVRNTQSYNKIVVSFDDDILSEPGWRVYIRQVEVAVRNDFNGVWYYVDTYNLDDFYIDEGFEVDFLNINLRGAVPSDDGEDITIQALKNFDFIPRIALGLEGIYDEQGNAIIAMGGGLYDYDIPDTISDIGVTGVLLPALSFAVPTTQESRNKGLKSGGTYKVGLRYTDEVGRLSSVVPQGEVAVPWGITPVFSDPPTIQNWRLDVAPLTPPPSWATHWQVCISPNGTQADYWQDITGRVLRYGFSATNDNIEEDADGPYIGFHYLLTANLNLLEVTGSALLANIFERIESPNALFIPESGDRIVIRGWYGDPFPGSNLSPPVQAELEEYVYKITGYSFVTIDEGGPNDHLELVVLIRVDEAPNFYDIATPPDIFRYFTEIYRPVTATNDEVYYEFGPCVKIVGGHGVVSLAGYGDTYTYYNEFAAPPKSPDDSNFDPHYLKERPTLYLNAPPEERNPDYGRPVAFDPYYAERNATSDIRYSDPFIPQSSVRGLSSFRGTSIFRINEAYGPLVKLVLNQNVLLAIARIKTQPIYVARDRLMDLSGNSTVGRSSSLFNIADELVYDFGTKYPGSVFYENGKTYAIDSRQGVAWRYSTGSGQFPISVYGLIEAFHSVGETIEDDKAAYTLSTAIDRRSQTILMYTGVGITYVLKEYGEPYWISGLDLIPEWLGNLDLNVVAFNNGEAWIIDENQPRANYFGVQYDSYIDFVMNDVPQDVKVLDSIEIHCSAAMFAPLIQIMETPSYPGGMTSQLIENKWTRYEGVLKADFLRDQTDPRKEFADIADPTERLVAALLRGRPLRGRTVKIRIQVVDSSQDCIIHSAYVNYVVSHQTVSTP